MLRQHGRQKLSIARRSAWLSHILVMRRAIQVIHHSTRKVIILALDMMDMDWILPPPILGVKAEKGHLV